jgi:hypothetical protein
VDAEEAGNDRAALYHLRRLAALCPDEADLHARIERIHARVADRSAGADRRGQWQQAWAARKRGAGRPGEGAWNQLRALEAMQHQRWDEALWYLDRVVGRAAGDWQWPADRASVHAHRGDRAARDADFRRSLSAGGFRQRDFVLTVADAWGREERWREVSGFIKKVLQSGHGDVTVVRALALAQLKRGDRAGHAELCGALLRWVPAKLQPEHTRLVVSVCVLSPEGLNDWQPLLPPIQDNLRTLERMDRGARGWEKKDLQAIHRSFLRTQGAVLHRLGRHAEAIASLEQAMKQSPDGKGGPAEWTWLALAHAASEKPPGREARRWLERARQALPGRDGKPLWDVVQLEVLLDEARRATRRFLEG